MPKQTITCQPQRLCLSVCIVAAFILSASCRHKPNTLIHEAFYYWKVNYSLNNNQQQLLTATPDETLYLRLFDIHWDAALQRVNPNAKVHISTPLKDAKVEPVIFITNSTFHHTQLANIDSFAFKTARLVDQMMKDANISYKKIQIDCDWTDDTREKYFTYLIAFKKYNTHSIEATIRLHQVKYREKTGVPPVDKGVLMFYNVGRITADDGENSIYNENDAGKYLNRLSSYPLPLDVALPLFSWAIHSRNGHVLQIYPQINAADLRDDQKFRLEKKHFKAIKSFFIKGIYIRENDNFKLEEMTLPLLKKAAGQLTSKLKFLPGRTVIFYELANIDPAKYSASSLEDIVDHFYLLLTSAAGIVWACADYGGDDYSAFAPEYFVNKHYSPFFYDSYNRYYAGADTSQKEDNNSRYKQLVSAEWQTFLGNQLSPVQIDFLLFSANKQQADSLNKIVVSKLDGRGKTFFNYLPLMKDCETYSIREIDNWYEKPVRKIPPAAIEKRINNALTILHEPFFRERLWFQLVRFHYFQDTTGKKTIQSFHRFEKEFPHNLLYYRTLGYLAGAEYAEKDYAYANYHYSLCYNYSWQMYLPSQWSFHPQEEADWQHTLKLAKNTEEKITLWHLVGIDHDPGRAIKMIAGLDPRSEKLDLLLSRLINTAESGGMQPAINLNNLEYKTVFPFNSDAASIQKTDSINAASYQAAYRKAYAASLKQSLAHDKDLHIIDSVANLKTISKPYYWHMAAGYLHFLHADFTAAQRFYALAGKELPSDNKSLTAQYKILKILLAVSTINSIDKSVENQLIEPLNWLADLRDDKKAVAKLRFATALSYVTDTLSGMYARQHEVIKANLFRTIPHIYMDSLAMDATEKLMLKSNKTPFEKTMLRFYKIDINQLYYQQALLAVYDENVSSAIQFMAKADSLNSATLLANPFNSSIGDCHDCEFTRSSTNGSPLKFLQTIQRLQHNLSVGQDTYRSALLLGNAFYNITHYGNSRSFFQNDLTSYASQPGDYDTDYAEIFTSQHIADKYYRLALKKAITNEERARCAYLLAKCDRNEFYNANVGPDTYEPYDKIPPAGEWANVLRNKYSETNYYREVLKECGFFRRYAGK